MCMSHRQASPESNVRQVWHRGRQETGKTRSRALYGGTQLTSTEERIVECLAAGLGNRQIAEVTGHSYFSVGNKLKKIYDKLGFDNGVEVALWWCSRHPGKLPKGE
jgi:DNA-binding NarL/FixJ family response regulator